MPRLRWAAHCPKTHFKLKMRIADAGLKGNLRRAIDFFEGDKINERALENLVRAAVEYNQTKLKKKAPAGTRAKVTQK
jgi:hypothetical protein